ncbi:MAG: DNA polymerase III subunit gamma/tau [Oscillospiraceae bacterium]|nr:DNA polymerase III subunit gamma/tau [Oscillospiraceae bacterium]
MHQALYRKYRPRTFDGVAGQEHITRTLKNQVSSGKCSHAYLFVGTRGTGKTTCAKILSRAVNCEAPVNGSPCNVCPSCRAIEAGSVTDVLEIDAASNNGVDNIRALREDAVFLPADLKKRVYIVDEVHMLSVSAFNALLKILEEPPAHLTFILATTELHRVPATIVSRCQRFSFRRLARSDISALLESVAESEGFALAPDAAAALARLADGSARDALSLLDQCSGGEGVDMPRVREIVGLPPRDLSIAMLDAVAGRDVKTAFELLDELYRSGLGAAALFDELSDTVRDALVMKLIPGDDKLLSGSASQDELAELAPRLDAGRLTHILSALSKARAGLTQGASDKTEAELCLASLCDERLDGYREAVLARLEALERAQIAPRVEQKSAPRARNAVARDAKPPWEEEPQASRREPVWSAAEPEPEASEPPPEISAPPPENPAPSPEAPEAPPPKPEPEALPKSASEGAVWPKILRRLREAGGMLVLPFVSNASAELTGDILTVSVSDSFAIDMLSRESAAAALRSAAEAELGRAVILKTKLSEAEDIKPVSQDVLDRLSDRLGDLIKFE